MAALENQILELRRQYGDLLWQLATPSLEFNKKISDYHALSQDLAALMESVPRGKHDRGDLRELQTQADVLLLLAQLKWGDYNLDLARTSYREDRYRGESGKFDLEDHHRKAITALTDTARNNYTLAERSFHRLTADHTPVVKTRTGSEPVLKFRGDSWHKGNYLTLAQIQERESYRGDLYHAIRSGDEITVKFDNWVETIGPDLKELKPYLGKGV